MLTEVGVGDTPVIVGQGILRVEADGFVEVLDGPPVLTEVGLGITEVGIGLGFLRVEAWGFIILSSRLFMVNGSVATPCQRKCRYQK